MIFNNERAEASCLVHKLFSLVRNNFPDHHFTCCLPHTQSWRSVAQQQHTERSAQYVHHCEGPMRSKLQYLSILKTLVGCKVGASVFIGFVIWQHFTWTKHTQHVHVHIDTYTHTLKTKLYSRNGHYRSLCEPRWESYQCHIYIVNVLIMNIIGIGTMQRCILTRCHLPVVST